MGFLQLVEMPLNIRNIGSFYSTITSMVDVAENMGIEPEKVAHNIYKIVDEHTFTLYYYVENDIIVMGVFLAKIRDGMFKVSAAGKNPDYMGRSPYVIEVYRAIINDLNPTDALLSDTQLTDDSIKVWKRLVKEFPGKVSIYDKSTREITPITNIKDINRVFGMAPELMKYQFMIRGQSGKDETNRIQQLAGIKKEKP